LEGESESESLQQRIRDIGINGGTVAIMIPGIQNRFLKWIYLGGPAVAYASLIFFLSSLSRFPEELPSFFGFDKIIHFIEYFMLGALLYRWFANVEGFPGKRRALIATIFVGIIYAFTDEWHQSFVPGRDSSLFDVLFDSLGVAAASFSFPLLLLRVKKL
jgi:VanZ family protein